MKHHSWIKRVTTTKKKSIAFLVATIAASGGCNTMPAPSLADPGVTQEMRDACPMLTDEVLEAFILAVSGLRNNGLNRDDALLEWVDGCDNIPPDGNFQGDVEACRACMPVIVDVVYAGA
jgi:hypothetical protein